MSHEPTLNQQQTQVRIHLAAMFRLTHYFGWDDTIWNHITARVPGSEQHFYMHRFGLTYDEICASNLIKIDQEGKVLEGPTDVNTTGFVIHGAIYLNPAFQDIGFVFHTHPRTAIAATAMQEIPFLVQDSAMLYDKVGYHDWEGISLDPEERYRIAENLGNNRALIMRNHGLLTVGKTAGECFMTMYYLIRLCEVALQATASGQKLAPTAPEIWQTAAQQYETFPPGKYEWPALLRRCDRLDSSYRY